MTVLNANKVFSFYKTLLPKKCVCKQKAFEVVELLAKKQLMSWVKNACHIPFEKSYQIIFYLISS